MRFIVLPIIVGIVATGGITLVLWVITKTGWTKADMIRAVGSLVTKSKDNALLVGILVHFTAGVLMSAIYLHVLSLLNLDGLAPNAFSGGVIGFIHGFVFSFVLVILAEHHPVEDFREADFEVAAVHLLGHVAYGVLIGIFFWILKFQGFDVSPAF